MGNGISEQSHAPRNYGSSHGTNQRDQVRHQPAPVQHHQHVRSDGQKVVNNYVNCGSQADAFERAKQAQKGKPPILHPPHQKTDEWHYHTASHDVKQGGHLVDNHFKFEGTKEQKIMAQDGQLRKMSEGKRRRK